MVSMLPGASEAATAAALPASSREEPPEPREAGKGPERGPPVGQRIRAAQKTSVTGGTSRRRTSTATRRTEVSMGTTKPLTVERAAEIPLPGDWLLEAACATPGIDPHLFTSGNPEDAKAICAACPVADQCRSYSLEHPNLIGTWGGLSERERRQHANPTSEEDSIVARCQAQPGTWVRVASFKHSRSAGKARVRLARQLAGHPIELRSRELGGTGSTLWARWTTST